MRERNREKEEWRLELGFGEGEQKFWVSGNRNNFFKIMMTWKIVGASKASVIYIDVSTLTKHRT